MIAEIAQKLHDNIYPDGEPVEVITKVLEEVAGMIKAGKSYREIYSTAVYGCATNAHNQFDIAFDVEHAIKAVHALGVQS